MESLNRRRYGGRKSSLNTNGYDYVDMGEAGIWATCNVGANSPEEYGLYFAWGETEGYPDAKSGKIFSWPDYKHGSSITDLFKYNTQSDRGSVDNITVLEPEDDAAHIILGGDWRIPTSEELNALYNACDASWVENYEGTGVNGNLFKLKIDSSKQLFFPSAGYAERGSMKLQGSQGRYWSSSLYTSISYYAYYSLFQSSNNLPKGNTYRYYGLPVRAFIPKP